MKSIRMNNFLSICMTLFCLCNAYALKIDRVILSTDTNPMYIQFWPLVAKAWKQLIGIKPTLALIADESVQVDESVGDVIRFDPIPGVPTALQAQVIRLLLPIYFEDDVSIISDIDMIPLNKDYFINSVGGIPDDCFVVYRDQAYGGARYPMCYNAAKGRIFKEIFKIHNIDEISLFIKKWHELGLGWCTDELVLYQYLTSWNCYSTRCTRLGHKVEKRIDRTGSSLPYNIDLLKENYYIDAHILRPYDTYKKEIDTLALLIGVRN